MSQPGLTPARWRIIEKLFFGGLEVEESGRAQWLAAQCAGDEGLRDQVLGLWQGEKEEARACEHYCSLAKPPARFGPYQVERLLGRGGMGTVWLARRADGQFDHTVALKITAPLVADEAFLRRFLDERQILAALQHPNITRLLDGGITPEGTPYLVMEYVDGEPIDSYCHKRALPLHRRLNLFLQVCDAVAYAHANCIVHRDLKPGNILVSSSGEVKLLDFGTAKLLVEKPATANPLTVPLLTPRYASPEQLRGERMATSSDVYSLGLILAELCTGKHPYPLGAALLPDVPTPEPDVSGLEGDLRTIAGKAMRFAPADRYQSVSALADDLRRYLACKPVLARPQTLRYRAAKFLRRHRVAVAAAVFVSSLSALTAYSIQQSRQARLEAFRAWQYGNFMQRLVFAGAPYSSSAVKGRNVTIQEALEAAGSELLREARHIPEVAANIRIWLAATFVSRRQLEEAEPHSAAARRLLPFAGDAAGLLASRADHLECQVAMLRGRMAEARSLCESALGYLRRHPEARGTDRAALLADLSWLLLQGLGGAKEAETLAREAFQTGKLHHGESNTITMLAASTLGLAQFRQGHFAEAEKTLTRLEGLQRAAGDSTLELASTLSIRSRIAAETQQRESELALARESFEVFRKWVPEAVAACSDYRGRYILALARSGLTAKALSETEQMLRACEDSPAAVPLVRAVVSYAAGFAYLAAGQTTRAEPHLQSAMEEGRKHFKPGMGVTGVMTHDLARCLMDLKRFSQARLVLEESRLDYSLSHGSESPGVARANALQAELDRRESAAAR